MYFPSYSGLSPEHRCQYLMWLQDITKPTNLSYVFLYYYGLERQLLSDNFESAFHEISRLLKFHNKKSFRSYAEMALIVSSLFWKRFDLIEQNPFLYDGVSNEELIIRKYIGAGLTSKDLMLLANSLKLKNRRYIKLYPEDFEMELEKLKVEYEMKNNYILECVDMADLKNKNSIAFANYSLKDTVRAIKIPNLITNPKFKKICLSLLKNAHDNLKISRSKK